MKKVTVDPEIIHPKCYKHLKEYSNLFYHPEFFLTILERVFT
jgi:hypothetical protein